MVSLRQIIEVDLLLTHEEEGRSLTSKLVGCEGKAMGNSLHASSVQTLKLERCVEEVKGCRRCSFWVEFVAERPRSALQTGTR